MGANKRRLVLGRLGETLAIKYLQEKGFRFIEKNYSITNKSSGKKIGEIDIVMQDDDEIVFVEVRTKLKKDPVSPLETITRAKRRQIERCAKIYLEDKNLFDRYARFDVVGIHFEENKDEKKTRIEHVKRAFYCGE